MTQRKRKKIITDAIDLIDGLILMCRCEATPCHECRARERVINGLTDIQAELPLPAPPVAASGAEGDGR
jgi:hypothetical protein